MTHATNALTPHSADVAAHVIGPSPVVGAKAGSAPAAVSRRRGPLHTVVTQKSARSAPTLARSTCPADEWMSKRMAGQASAASGAAVSGDDGAPPSASDAGDAAFRADRLVARSRVRKMAHDEQRFRTELCNKFSETGECPYGDRCQFAHGVAQLRHMPRHPKYKTERCTAYWNDGVCTYGPRCRFVHRERDHEHMDDACLVVKRALPPSLTADVLAELIDPSTPPLLFELAMFAGA